MTGYAIGIAAVANGNADQESFGVMAGIAPVMNGVIEGGNGYPREGAGGSGMAG